MRFAIGLGLVLLSASARALPPAEQQALVQAARSLLGTPYSLGGRLSPRAPGIDCQGVLFAALEAVQPCGWRSFSVYPTVSLRTGELGHPVPGLAPVSTQKLALDELQPGDFVFLISPARNPAEPAISQLEGQPVWVWHTGLYAGAGKWIVGDHYAGKVVEVELLPYLREHADAYTGVFILRSAGVPSPPRCRHHRPLLVR